MKKKVKYNYVNLFANNFGGKIPPERGVIMAINRFFRQHFFLSMVSILLLLFSLVWIFSQYQAKESANDLIQLGQVAESARQQGIDEIRIELAHDLHIPMPEEYFDFLQARKNYDQDPSIINFLELKKVTKKVIDRMEYFEIN